MNNIIFKTLLLKGEAGNDIQSVEKTSTSGLVDTYTITLTDGTTTTFEVTNGKSIVSIEKTSSVGYVDTYTITYNDGSTDTFEITLATITVDDALSDTSENPVENRVVTTALEDKASTTRVEAVYRATKGMIAPSETSPATDTHTVGSYITYNGKMYEVISPIAIGDTLSSSNISETNTGEELSQINADLSDSHKHEISESTKVDLTKEQYYTTLADGYFRIGFNQDTLINEYAYGYINRIMMLTANTPTSSTEYGYMENSVFVRKGSVISFSGSTHAIGTFYPLG